jgi:hypothetical protein
MVALAASQARNIPDDVAPMELEIQLNPRATKIPHLRR